MSDAISLLRAVDFSARKHRDQRRKDQRASPYINHPIAVAQVLAEMGHITDAEILMAAILHDTVEDTQTTADELRAEFGERVCMMVLEVTDDTTLPISERKAAQIERAKTFSPGAALIKIADKICNVRDVSECPPVDWSTGRRCGYLDFAEQVVANCARVNSALDEHFAAVLAAGRIILCAADTDMPPR